MVQRTFYALPHEAPAETPAWEPAADDVHTLRHGYNMADLDRLAWMAIRRNWGWSHEPRIRYEIAWTAIAERLYAAVDAPDLADLVFAGQDAISGFVTDEKRHHGVGPHGEGRPKFAAFWEGSRLRVPDPAGGVVDRIALWQIWAHLSEAHRRVLAALAVHGDQQSAADALGSTYASYASRLHQARKAFVRLWHEHEEPSGMWGADRRVWRRGQPAVTERRLTTHDHLRLRKGRPKAEITHGASRYVNHGCRCLTCTEAIRIMRLDHARSKGAQPRRIIPPEVRNQIYERRIQGDPVKEVAAAFDVSEPLVYRIMRERRATA